jgi:hypothetical protein
MPALHTLVPQTVSSEASEEVMTTQQPIDEEEQAHGWPFIGKRGTADGLRADAKISGGFRACRL